MILFTIITEEKRLLVPQDNRLQRASFLDHTALGDPSTSLTTRKDAQHHRERLAQDRVLWKLSSRCILSFIHKYMT